MGVPPLSPGDEEKALDAAVRSNCGMRWVEEYMAELLIRIPQATAKLVKTKATASDKISVTRAEFNQKMASVLEALESTRRAAKGLEVKLRLALQIARSTTPDQQKNFLDPDQIEALIESLEKARAGLRYGTSITQKQRLLRESELQVHGTDLLRLLDNWFTDRAFAMKSCSLLDPALDLYSSFERILFTWQHLSAVEVVE
jgi:multidrug efflux pump subunit AcrA (membrane-fusion protein)